MSSTHPSGSETTWLKHTKPKITGQIAQYLMPLLTYKILRLKWKIQRETTKLCFSAMYISISHLTDVFLLHQRCSAGWLSLEPLTAMPSDVCQRNHHLNSLSVAKEILLTDPSVFETKRWLYDFDRQSIWMCKYCNSKIYSTAFFKLCWRYIVVAKSDVRPT